MKRILNKLLSMEVMIVLLLFMAFSCAVATFVENDFGPLGAKSFIYGTTWFESVMVLLTLGVIANIIWFKMYKKDKFFIFMIHVSLVFILIGAGLTRYVGYEGIMTIPEGSMQNQLLSNDEYINVKLFRKGELVKEHSTKVLMTQLSQTNFSEDIRLNSEYIHINFNRFVPNAIEKIVPDEKGEALINLIVTKFDGADSYDLRENKSIQTQLLQFNLNNSSTDNKPAVNFTTDNNKIYVSSNIQIAFSTLEGRELGVIKPNEKAVLKPHYLYRVAQTRFITPEFSAQGKIDVVSTNVDEKNKDKAVNAVIMDVMYRGLKQTITLFGKGGSTQGYKRHLKLGAYTLEAQWGAKILSLPFAILLDDFKLERYPGSNAPSAYSSDVKIYDKELGESFPYTIYMNHTLDHRGYRFFQSSYKQDESATILSVNKDPGRVPTYIGYFLLFTGLILSLFMKKGRFQKLARKKYTLDSVKASYKLPMILLTALLLQFNTPAIAQEAYLNIDKNHAELLGSTLVQDYQGRIKPLNSLAIEITNKVTKKNELFGLNSNQVFLSMSLYPNKWQMLKFVKVSNPKLRELLNLEKNAKYLSFEDIYTKDGNYALTPYVEEANSKKASKRNKFDKEVIKVDERLNIAYSVFTGSFLKLFPKLNDDNNTWISPLTLDGLKERSPKEYEEVSNLMQSYFEALKSSNWNDATEILQSIQTYQYDKTQIEIPSSTKINAEIFFNQYNIFSNLTLYYLILGLILLGFVFAKIFKPQINLDQITKITLVLFFVGFMIHTLGLGLRWYIADHAPWSNAYETMIYIAWAIVLSGMLFVRESNLALATTGVFAGIILFVAHLSWLEPQVTTLTPVLKSYWLTIHVSVITASYGFLGLSALLGFITLLLMIIMNPKEKNERFFSILTSIKESRRINEMSMLIGIVLLVMGNFLGGIWANESWGRYWGWDPKETWTLVSIIIYAVIIHLHYIKGLSSNYIFASLSMVSYSAIIMTYFGVNYYLAGMHSYAAGDPIPIPTFVPVSAVVMLIMIVLAARNRKAC